MFWIDKIAKDLDVKYKTELEKYDMTAMEVIKIMWQHTRKMLSSDEAPDLYIPKFGTFRVPLGRLYILIGYHYALLHEPDEYAKRSAKVDELVDLYNSRVGRQFSRTLKSKIVRIGDTLTIDGNLCYWEQTTRWQNKNARKKRIQQETGAVVYERTRVRTPSNRK
jgi:hypothetical protein